MRNTDAVREWQSRDAAFEGAFEAQASLQLRHMLGRLFGCSKPPSLNAYRDHLLAGHTIGALPVEGAPVIPEFLQRLAAEDYDRSVTIPGSFGMQTQFGRRGIAKIAIDVMAAKLPIFDKEVTSENAHGETPTGPNVGKEIG